MDKSFAFVVYILYLFHIPVTVMCTVAIFLFAGLKIISKFREYLLEIPSCISVTLFLRSLQKTEVFSPRVGCLSRFKLINVSDLDYK